MTDMSRETIGAWIVHHGRKIKLDTNGSAEFPALDMAAKAADLLSRLSGSETSDLDQAKVVAITKAAGLNPIIELQPILGILEEKRLVKRTQAGGLEIIGVTTRATLSHAADFFNDGMPSQEEQAAIELAETTSQIPVLRTEIAEEIGDSLKMTAANANDFINRAEQIGFVDGEGEGKNRLLFNGNLFRRECVEKTNRVLTSLTGAEQRKVAEFSAMLATKGCINAIKAEAILGVNLFDKLKAAGVYDLNTVSNESGENVYVTAPNAFHKFVDPMIDDCFDMAKALTAALTYGMTERDPTSGRIYHISALLQKLVNGYSVGPAPAIAHDYRVLEQNRVVEITKNGWQCHMRLLKKEVGEMALKVLTTGNASEAAVEFPSAPMSGYVGPEGSRHSVRKRQGTISKRATQDILGAIRGGRK